MSTKRFILQSVGFVMLLVSSVCHADNLPFASYTCHVSGNGDDLTPTDCPDNLVPDAVTATYEPDSNADHPPFFKLFAGTKAGDPESRIGPKAFAGGSSRNNVSPGANASFSYSLTLTPYEAYVSQVTGLSFRVYASGSGSCHASTWGSDDSTSSAYCSAGIEMFGQNESVGAYAGACAVDANRECDIGPVIPNFEFTFHWDLNTGEVINVGGNVEIRLQGATGAGFTHATARANLDPNFWIDPESTVMIDGQEFLATDVVELTFSEGVEYSGAPPDSFLINAGLNDAWVNPDAPFQGLFITVFPDVKLVFLAWFTFDSEIPDGDATATFGAPDQRWITALGTYDGNRVEMKAELTSGGKFNASEPLAEQDTTYGTIILEFSNCETGEVTYLLPSAKESGSFPIERVLDSNVALCEALSSD